MTQIQNKAPHLNLFLDFSNWALFSYPVDDALSICKINALADDDDNDNCDDDNDLMIMIMMKTLKKMMMTLMRCLFAA